MDFVRDHDILLDGWTTFLEDGLVRAQKSPVAVSDGAILHSQIVRPIAPDSSDCSPLVPL